MKHTIVRALLLAGLVSALVPMVAAVAQAQDKPVVKIPEAGVPEVMSMEGKFVRAAYNNEGYVILGYQVVNRSIGEEWMLLEFGVTVRDGVRDFTLRRRRSRSTAPRTRARCRTGRRSSATRSITSRPARRARAGLASLPT
jgi:hypothetical protein